MRERTTAHRIGRVGTLAMAAGVALSVGVAELVGQPGSGMRAGPRHDAVGDAPPPARMAPMAERHVTMLERQLGLDEAQTEKLRVVFSDHFSAMQAIHEHRAMTGREQHRSQMIALWRGTDARVAEILTPEQNERYQAMRTRRGPGTRRGRPGGTGMRRPPIG